MPPYAWSCDADSFGPAWSGEATALVVWARWATEGLYYLDDLDSGVGGPVPGPSVHPWYVVDLAHIRWAAGSSMTALDLCAAAIARREGLGPRTTRAGRQLEFDVRDLESAAQNGLSGPGANWVADVLADHDYELMEAIRHPFTHARLSRQFARGDGGSKRTHIVVPLPSGERHVEAGQSVDIATRLATDHVEALCQVTKQGAY